MKNSHKLVLIGIGFLAFGENCLAETKLGLGTGTSSVFSQYYGGVISMPIRLDSLLIEPYVGYFEDLEDLEDSEKDGPEYREEDRQSYQAGVGLYGISNINADFQLYYGGALAVANSEYYYERKYTINDQSWFVIDTDETDIKEYMVKPTLGISYLINKNFSFSIDAGIYYFWGEKKIKSSHYDSDQNSSSYTEAEFTVDTHGTSSFTRALFRMMF